MYKVVLFWLFFVFCNGELLYFLTFLISSGGTVYYSLPFTAECFIPELEKSTTVFPYLYFCACMG